MARVTAWPVERPRDDRLPGLGGAMRLARFGLVFLVAFGVLILPQMLWLLVRPEVPSPVARLFLRSLASAAGLRVEPAGAAPGPGTLILANHLSWTDILVLGGWTRTAFVARADVRDWPVFGLLARLNGTVFVDRRARLAIRTQADALERALDRGSVVLFPEGTTGDGSDVLPFRPALLDAAADRTVRPIALNYVPRERRPWCPGERAAFAWDGDKRFLPHVVHVIASGGARCRIMVLPSLAPSDRKTRAADARRAIRSALLSARS